MCFGGRGAGGVGRLRSEDQKKEIRMYRPIIDGPHPEPLGERIGGKLTLTKALQLANQNDEQLAIAGEIIFGR